MSLTIEELATICDAVAIQGNTDTLITSAADIKSANEQQITLLSDARYAQYLPTCGASACIVKENALPEARPTKLTFIICKDPELSFIQAVNALYPSKTYPAAISSQSAIASSAQIAATAHIAAFVSIGEQCSVGENTVILAGVSIGTNVTIGRNCTLHPQVVIYDNTVIHDNVTIHAGTVIAADGFGYKNRRDQHIKVPHVGNVIIHENVEIGANTCIDRGAFGSTIIGAGTKIDNNVQIGHNNIIGKNVIICGQTGISGSCNIEDNAILAGSSGIADHVKIGHHAVIMARSGISHDVAAATQVFGSPAKERKTAWKELAALSRLPELLKQFKSLQAKIEHLEGQIEAQSDQKTKL